LLLQQFLEFPLCFCVSTSIIGGFFAHG
jgi:hypothetical protein